MAFPTHPRTVDSVIPTLSLFSGAGGLDIGFHAAGFQIVACVEVESAYCRTLERNSGPGRYFSHHPRVVCEDIRLFDPRPYAGLGIECIIGGPPCQTFSAAGRRSGGVLGTNDDRGRLFQTYCEILDVVQPQAFVFENVYGLPGANGGGPWAEIVAAFSELGYSLHAEVIDAADYGVPQHRERLIMVGTRGADYRFPLPTNGPDSPSRKPLMSAGQALADMEDPGEVSHDDLGGRYGHLLKMVPPGLNYSFFTAEMGHPEPIFAWRSKFHDFLYKVDPSAPCRTIKARPGKFTGPFHWKNRHFTVEELKRLQTFPDDYEIVGSYGKVVEQIGNSVPPRLAQVIATSVREQLLRPGENMTYEPRPAGFRSTFRQRQRERTKAFKRVAEREISRLYGVQGESPRSSPVRHESYAVVAGSFFEVERLASAKRGGSGTRYSVDIEDKGASVEIRFRRGRGLWDASLAITGLEKYLGRIDSLRATARLQSPEDLFHMWSAVEEALVSRSRFLTLIDIYGHYANRGDTVGVSMEFSDAPDTPLMAALDFFSQSQHCGYFMSEGVVAEKLEIDEATLAGVIGELRALRLDVRTRATHPTIADGEVICTYPFPLLSGKAHLERSAQLRAQS